MSTLNRRDVLKQISLAGAAAAAGGFSLPALADKPLKVGLVYPSPVAAVGWSKQHDLAREAMIAAFPGKIQTTVIQSTGGTNAEAIFRNLARDGHKLIFGTSFDYGTPMLKVAETMPDTVFEHCSGIKTAKNLGTFEARYFEGSYVAGVAAAKMTKSGILGFISSYPVPDVVGAVNGFLLGARSVNPKIVCKVVWLNSWYDPGKEKAAAITLISQGADVLQGMTDTTTTVQTCAEKGVWCVSYASDMAAYGPKSQLTGYVLDWSSDYIDAAKAVLAGTWRTSARWEGLAAGVVKMAPYNSLMPADAIVYVKQQEQAIIDGKLHPFAGPLKDQHGKERVASGAVLPDDEIKGINWLVDGVTANL
ncbi:MAG: Nucleoside ABC transporter, substrate-binding protein [Burkholderiaceae bacterium]|jgi:simple sugar transport system substrate-binding protein|nr:MAG: Nucleoside ABC transporter, substrate-binding protein [Burkholderiaceae bacterium]